MPLLERVLDNDSNALYSAAGYLLFERDGILLGQPFDLDSRRLTADAIPIASDVAMYLDLRGNFTVSDSGVLVYSGEGGTPSRSYGTTAAVNDFVRSASRDLI